MKTWNALGYRVKHGEQAIWIRGPWIRQEPDPTTGAIVDRLVGYLALPVWDVAQLEGDPRLPSIVHPLAGDFAELYSDARAHIICAGITVVEEPMPRGLHGLSWGGRITINPALTTSEKLCVLWHELAHEAGHWDDGLALSHAQQELEAQSACWLIGQLHGVDVAWSRDYILHWRGEVHGLHESFRRIQAIVMACLAILRFDQRDGAVPAR
jgi:hypothetical protein